MFTRRRSVALAVALGGLAFLTACAPGALDADASSTPEATGATGDVATQCQAVLDEVGQLSTDIATLANDFGSNPLAAVGLVPSIIDRATGLGDLVNDPQLAERVDGVTSIATTAVEDAQNALQGGDVEGASQIVSDAVAQVEPAVAELQAYCAQ